MKLDYIYYHVGRIAVGWADAEDAVDACLKMFAKAIPDSLYQRPISTKRRITTFRKCLAKLRISDAQRQRGVCLIDSFARLAQHRTWTAHGSTTDDTYTGETYRKHGSWVRYKRRNLSTGQYELRDYQLSELEEMGDLARNLATWFWEWLCEDLGCSTPKKTEKVIRRIGVGLPRLLPRRKQIN